MADTIKPTFTFNELEKIEKSMTPEPFSFGIGHTVITFPDPMGLSTEEAEKFLSDMVESRSPVAVMRRWLPEKDAEMLISKLSFRKLTLLLRQASAHYNAAMGDMGEGGASTIG